MDVTNTDLSRELTDYEERRALDRQKLNAMIGYCRTAQCRTRYLLDYFGENPPEDFRCGHCDVDVAPGLAGIPAPPPPPNHLGSADHERIAAEEIDEEAEGFEPGEEVSHTTFGEGIVLAVKGDRTEVDFGGHGVRTIRTDFLARC